MIKAIITLNAQFTTSAVRDVVDSVMAVPGADHARFVDLGTTREVQVRIMQGTSRTELVKKFKALPYVADVKLK